MGETVYIEVDTQYMRGNPATVYLYESDDPGTDDLIKPLTIQIPVGSDTGRTPWTVEWHEDTDGLTILPEYELWRSTDTLETVHSRVLNISETTPPSAPGTPSMDAADDSGRYSNDQITRDSKPKFGWSPASDAHSGIDGYWVSYKDSTPEGSGGDDYWVESNSWELGVLESAIPDGTYTLYVRAKDNAGNLGNVTPSSPFTIDTVKPNVPGNLHVEGGSPTTDRTPLLDWDGVSGAWRYHVQVEDWFGSNYESGDPTDSQYQVQNDLPYGTIYWKANAEDVAGNTSDDSPRSSFEVVKPVVTAIRWEDAAGNELAEGAVRNVGETVYIEVDTGYMRGNNAVVYLYEDDGFWGSDDLITSLTIPIPTDSDTGRISWDVQWNADEDFASDLNPFQSITPEYRLWRSTEPFETVHSGRLDVNNPITELIWQDTLGQPASELFVGDLVILHAETTGLPEGTPLTFNIYEDDVFFDDAITSILTSVQADGTAEAFWQVPWVPDTLSLPELFFEIEDYDVSAPKLDVVLNTGALVSDFFAVAPWQMEAGEDLPLFLGFHRSRGIELFDIGLDNVVVELGTHQLPIYDFDGSGDEYFTLPADSYWYTQVTIPYDTYRNHLDANGDLAINVTYNYAYEDSETDGSPWAERHQHAENLAVDLANALPGSERWSEWDGWYQGDVHWHSGITDSNYLVYQEFGTPLAIMRELAGSMGLDWITITDHSFDIDDGGAGDVFRPLVDYQAPATLYEWSDLESDPAFGFADGFGFIGGEEISINSENIAYQGWLHQHHMLAYGFDSTDPYVVAGRGASVDLSNWNLGTEELVSLDYVFEGPNGVEDLALFTYVAHPTSGDLVMAAPWTDTIVNEALRYEGGGSTALRGFEFWNGGNDSSGRDESLQLWEDILADMMQPGDAKDQEFHWYLSGGSDDHLSYYLKDNSRTGDVRTVAYAPSFSETGILDSMFDGRAFVTNGPWLSMGVDTNGDDDVMDFGVDTMLGEHLVVTDPTMGVLSFDWPDQSAMPWGEPSYTDIKLWHYNSDGIPNEVALSGDTFDAYADWLENQGEYYNGWQAYRAELHLGDYSAYTNPIWLYFDVNEDLLEPTAALEPSDPITAAGGSTTELVGTYQDNVAVDLASLGNSDIRVTGPNGYDELASLVGINPSSPGAAQYQVTYEITAPGGTWDAGDNGVYTVSVEPNQVSDTSGNYVAAGDLGDLVVAIGLDAPVAQIDSITPNPAQPPDDAITFQGSGTDTDGTIVGWEWSSNLDGALGTTEDLSLSSYELTVGTHEISLRVRDDDGLWSDPASAQLVVNNAMPTASIDNIPTADIIPGSDVTLLLGGEDHDESGQGIIAGELLVDGSLVDTPFPGSYVLTAPVAAGQHDISYRVQDNEGAWSDSAIGTLTVDDGLYIVSWQSAATHGQGVGEALLRIPDDGSFSEPRVSGVNTLLVTFTEAIDPASFTPDGIHVYGLAAPYNNPVDLSGIDIVASTRGGNTIGVITFSEPLPDIARYLVTIEGVTSAGGSPVLGDNDRILTALLGDANGDLNVNTMDANLIKDLRGQNPIASGISEQLRSDLTLDGRINNTDVGGMYTVRFHDARFIPDPELPGVAPQAAGQFMVSSANVKGSAPESPASSVRGELPPLTAGSPQMAPLQTSAFFLPEALTTSLLFADGTLAGENADAWLWQLGDALVMGDNGLVDPALVPGPDAVTQDFRTQPDASPGPATDSLPTAYPDAARGSPAVSTTSLDHGQEERVNAPGNATKFKSRKALNRSAEEQPPAKQEYEALADRGLGEAEGLSDTAEPTESLFAFAGPADGLSDPFIARSELSAALRSPLMRRLDEETDHGYRATDWAGTKASENGLELLDVLATMPALPIGKA